MFSLGEKILRKKDSLKRISSEFASLAKKMKGKGNDEKTEAEEKGMESMEVETVEGVTVNSKNKGDDILMENAEDPNATVVPDKKVVEEKMVSVKVMENALEKKDKQILKEKKEKDGVIKVFKEENDKLKTILRNEMKEKEFLKKKVADKEKLINEIQARFRELQQEKDMFQRQNNSFRVEMEGLKADNVDLDKRLATFETEKSSLAMDSGSYEADGPTPSHLDSEIANLSSATIGFVRPFLKLLKKEGVDSKIVGSLQPNAVLKETLDIKNALSGFLIHQFLLDFENESYECGGPSKLGSNGRGKACFKDFHALEGEEAGELYKKSELFEKFVNRKWEVVSRGFLNSSDSFTKIIDVSQPSDTLQSSFIGLAMAAFRLHHLAFSFDPPAAIIRPKQGTPVDGRYIKLTNIYDEDWTIDQKQKATTEFMVLPGFRVRSAIQPCRVHPVILE